MMLLIISICVAFSVGSVKSEGCTGFTYDGEEGQHNWGKRFNQCSGKHQSPIDIDSVFVQMVALSPLEMVGFNSTVGKALLTNNGHTAMMKIEGNVKPTITGGPLTGEYKFEQLHFHWGANDSMGSEDKIDGKSFPLELHIVFSKIDYLNIDSALNHSDGLTVLACIYELTDKPNLKYEPFVQLLSKVQHPGDIAEFPEAPVLLDLLPKDLSQYFTYHGSLTTPPCSEAVTWIDFRQTIKIASCQLEAFRKLEDSHGHRLINNFRAIQPLGDRIVRRNIGNKMNTKLNGYRRNRVFTDQTNIHSRIAQVEGTTAKK
ncbi:Carbonic anhydrase 6 [Pseudolycoriella hygida]|uniref:carbonic anhydrase n=1 Tax=Pseudolycoriella hygida TaxID=35572 RepID=A0A9Q0S7G2_9DIPT|nr:Carbonic anhydrase 6 [Pseudolycoriella hygida]